ncbi:hypothetical protein [Roseovarius mucosus]|uniref:hypothetical protein n=1 Tax=Roseovarius mucosus TaxID=215743 RepID=UPI0035CF5B6C
MTRLEIAQAVPAGAVGAFTALGAALAQHGTSTLALTLALAGAVMAALELDPFQWRKFVSLVLFNSLVGVIGGAVIAAWLAERGYLSHPLALGGLSFMVAWLGHDWLRPFKGQAIGFLLRALEAVAGRAK